MTRFAPEPLRVLMTADTVGGVWTYALELARALAPHGAQIALATMGAPVSLAQRAELTSVPNVELFESRHKLEWMDDPWSDVDRAGDWLLEIAGQFEPDVMHLNGYAHAALAWPAPVLIAAHSCVLSWWEAVKGERAPDRYAEYERRVSSGLQSADLVVAPTRALLDSLAQNYRALSPCRCRVIPNGRDARMFRPARKQHVIFGAGRIWDEAKNVRALDTVASELAWPVHVAGDTEHPDGSAHSFDHLVSRGKLAAPELARQLGEAAIFASPARYEPFGLAALEAGLCGCALVLGDIASLRDVWSDAAIFVAPDDRAALQDTLNELIADEEKRSRHGCRARERALQFSADRMAVNYLAAYEEISRATQIPAPNEQKSMEASLA